MKAIRLLLAALFVMAQAAQAIEIGDFAPDFSAVDTHGRHHNLSEYRGRYVVLEWSNRDCPFVENHYEIGDMQRLQRYWTARDVVWLTVISSAPGKKGYVTADQENEYLREEHAAPTAVLLDPTGELGHLYGAESTPEMFVVSPGGKLLYQGAFDDRAKVGMDGIPGERNYVDEALRESLAGKKILMPETHAYGFSVKYAE